MWNMVVWLIIQHIQHLECRYHPMMCRLTRWTQNICITFLQYWTDVVQCYTVNGLCLLGRTTLPPPPRPVWIPAIKYHYYNVFVWVNKFCGANLNLVMLGPYIYTFSSKSQTQSMLMKLIKWVVVDAQLIKHNSVLEMSTFRSRMFFRHFSSCILISHSSFKRMRYRDT